MSEWFDGYTDEFLQRQLEKQIIEACELHNWATAISVANPVDILIMLEEDEDDISDIPATNVIELRRVL